jgi:hypothetical protein
MPSRLPDIEVALTAALQARGDAYVDAQAALEALRQRLHAGEALHRLCPELQQVLSTIRTLDERLAPLQEQWRTLSASPGPELAAQIARHQAQLERTLALVERFTAMAAADRSLLAPRLDEAARGRRMRAAYAAAEGSG